MFDLSQDFIVDAPFIPQFHGRLSLGTQQLPRERNVARVTRGGRSNLLIVLPRQFRKAMLVALSEVFVNACKLGSIFCPRLFKVCQRRFDHRPSRLFLFWLVASCTRKPKRGSAAAASIPAAPASPGSR